MSNLTGSVDVVREQERRARLQLLENREPSPQPIFGEPVKVELEDETSRRIKNTLGDISQVLINDPKNLLGIARGATGTATATAAASHRATNNHHHPPGVKRPGGPPNGLHKQPPPIAVVRPNHHPHKAAADKRPSYAKIAAPSKGGAPSAPNHHSHSHHHHHHPDKGPKVRDPTIKEHQHRRSSSESVTVNINISVSGGGSVLNSNIISTSASSGIVNGTSKSASSASLMQQAASVQGLPNGLISARPHLKGAESVKIAQNKHFLPNLVIPDKGDKGADSHIELETILREMKQAVPPPLTAIQTPRTEDSGFAFPTEELPFMKEEEQTVSTEPPPPPPPPPPDESEAPDSLNLANASQFNLQEDLEISSDEETVPEVKNPPAEYSKSAAASAMEAPPALSTRSSSSDSCESDSEESSSESNDSDSSASSEASEVEDSHPKQSAPQMWGLSNFFDETRRNHSPAFVPIDNNTNSSTAVKEEPMQSVGAERDSFSLVDEDSVNHVLRKYSDPHTKDYLRSPRHETVEMAGAPITIKTEILSPISSPIRSPPRLLPPVIRGPRTPPTPPSPIKEPDEEYDEPEELHLQAFIRSKSPRNLQPHPPQNKSKVRSDTRDDVKLQSEKSKKQNNRNRNESVSPRVKPSPASSYADDEVFSASKSLPDTPVKEKDATNVASCSVPSDSLEFCRETSSKSRHKHSISSSNKSVKSHSESNELSEKRSSSKSHSSKSKHSTKQSSQNSSSNVKQSGVKSSGGEESKKRSKSESKERHSESSSKRSRDASSSNISGHSKSAPKSSKQKSKSSRSPKHVHESKKTEGKKKKKFSIKNFLQSPTITKKESERVSDGLPYFSPSPERSPIPELKSDLVESQKRSTSPQRSNSPVRSNSKNTGRLNHPERRGHTPRSARASSNAPSESSGHHHEGGEFSRKGQPGQGSARNSSRSRDRVEGLPIPEPPQLLSPIPQHSPIPNYESAIPAKIMVCIPLEKLERLPAQVSDGKLPKSKPYTNPDDGSNSAHKKSSSRDKISKHDSEKRPQTKEKTKSESSKNRTSKGGSVKKEKSSKPPIQPSEPKSKPSSTVNSKSSIKIVVDKSHCEETTASKKRKDEDECKQQVKKKQKVSSRPTEKKIKEHQSGSKKELTANSTESTGKIKTLERCDSSSSLSSLCSQQSQRSSKASKEKLKDGQKGAPESKRIKAATSPLLTVKEIKQEKEDFPAIHIKKEPGLVSNLDKSKLKIRDKLPIKEVDTKVKKVQEWGDGMNISSQYCHWEEPCKVEDTKAHILTSQNLVEGLNRDIGSDWDHLVSEIGLHKELKESSNLNKLTNPTHQHLMPMDYYWTEGKKQKHLAEKEKDPLLQVLKYFEATVLFILTSQQKEEYSKDPDSVHRFYKQTLNFSLVINTSLQKLQSQYHNANPGSTEFKLLILCLKCQSLLHVKLYNLKIKEIKEQQKGVSDFFRMPRMGGLGSVPSPHSPTPSPAGSVNSVGSQSSGYSSSDINGNHPRNSHTVNVPQTILDMICRQHTHLKELHDGHDLWEQADMYMTRSNLREFFRDVADQSEPLTLHSTIKDLVNYIQKGLSLIKKCLR